MKYLYQLIIIKNILNLSNSQNVKLKHSNYHFATLIISLFLSNLFFNKANAQAFTSTYNFAGVTNSSGLTDPTPVPTATGVTFGSFTAVGQSNANPNAGGRFSFQGWPLGATGGSDVFLGNISLTQYYQVNLTIQNGFTVDIDSVKFTFQRSGTGVRQFAVRSSDDGYANNITASNAIDPQIQIVPTDVFQETDVTTTCNNNFLFTFYSGITAGTVLSFRFYGWNAEGSGGTFSIDNVSFYGSATAVTNTISTGIVTSTPFNLANCTDTATAKVAFTSIGTFSGNKYTAQLSDATGSFTSSVDIGTLTSNTNGPDSIPITIPAGTLTGVGTYRIRIISSSPVVIGTNSATFTINQSGSCGSLASDYFQSRNSGNWNSSTSWQTSPDNGITPWINSTRVPDSASKGIAILAGHNISVAVSLNGTSSVDQVTVNSGGTLTINTGITFTVVNGTGTDLDVFGIMVSAGATVSTGATIVFEANSFYNNTHITSVSVPVATWDITSTCIISGITSTASGVLNQTFGNFIWSCSQQSVPYYINQSPFRVNNKFSVDTTGSSYLSLSSDAASVAYANTLRNIDVNGGVFYATYNTITNGIFPVMWLTVSGNINVYGGTFCLVGGTTDKGKAVKYDASMVVFLSGNLSVSGSNSNFYGSTTTNKFYIGRIQFIRPFALGPQTVNFTNAATNTFGYVNYYIDNSVTLNILSGGLPIRSSSNADYDSVTVNTGGYIDFGADGKIYKATGSSSHAAFRAVAASNIITANPNGLVGNGTNASLQVDSLQFGTNSTLGQGVNYTFNAATTTAFPTLVQARTTAPQRFFNPDTVTLNANITINRALTVTHVLNLNTFILTQDGLNLTFSSITGTGSVSADSLSAITVITGGGISPVGTLRLTTGFQKTGNIQMNRAGTLILGSDVVFDVTGPTPNSNCLILSNGTVDASGRTLSFISAITELPISRTLGVLTVSNTTNLIFGLPGYTGGNAYTIPLNTFSAYPVSINNLTVNRTNALQFAVAQGFTINGTLDLIAGVLINNNNVLTFQNGNIPITRTAGALSVGSTGSLVFGTSGNVGGNAATIPNSTFPASPVVLKSIYMNRTNSLTLGNQGFSVSDTVNIVSGTLDALTNTLDSTAKLIMSGGLLKLAKINVTLPELTGTYSLTGGTVEIAGTGTDTIRAGVDYYNLTSSSTGNRVLPSGATIGIKATLTPGTNITTITGSTVNFKGSSQPVDAFTTSLTGLYKKQHNIVLLSGSGVKTMADNFTVIDSIKLYSGLSLSMQNDTITFRSTRYKTGRFASKDATSTISYGAGTGRFITERFIPAHRAWRLMSAPTGSNNQFINDGWQESADSTSHNPLPGYGTHISGGAGKTEAMGYDLGPGNASIYQHNVTTNKWEIIPATTNANYNGGPSNAFMLFVRGSRAINLPTSTPYTIPDTTTLRTTGKFATSVGYFGLTAGFRAIPNPIPAPVNFHALVKSGIIGGDGGDAYYLWDPNLTGTNYVGAYVAFAWDSLSGVYDKSVIADTASSNITNTGVIPSSAAFMIHVNSGASISIGMTAATTDAGPDTYLFRPMGEKRSRLRSSLYAFNPDNSKSLNDGALVIFGDKYTNEVDNEDMVKLENFAENISMITKGNKICIERRAPVMLTDTLQLNIGRMRQKNYELQFAADTLFHDETMIAYLQDNYANTENIISLTDTTKYNFTVSADAASFAANRFRIIFKPSQVLPVTFTSIKAFKQNKNVTIEWKVANEINIAGYEVERAINAGQSFSKINSVLIPATGNNNSGNIVYNFLDEQPIIGDNFYRIKSIGSNGTIKYTTVVKISFTKGLPSVSVYPNPVIGNTIGLQLIDMPTGLYSAKLINQLGQTIGTFSINHTVGNQQEMITSTNTLANGVYRIELVKPDGDVKVLSFIK